MITAAELLAEIGDCRERYPDPRRARRRRRPSRRRRSSPGNGRPPASDEPATSDCASRSAGSRTQAATGTPGPRLSTPKHASAVTNTRARSGPSAAPGAESCGNAGATTPHTTPATPRTAAPHHRHHPQLVGPRARPRRHPADGRRRCHPTGGRRPSAKRLTASRHPLPQRREVDTGRLRRRSARQAALVVGERFIGGPGCTLAAGVAAPGCSQACGIPVAGVAAEHRALVGVALSGHGRARAGSLIDDDPRVRSFITLVVLVAGLTLAAGASGRPVHRLKRSPRSVTLQWVGDMAISTERGLPPGGLDRAMAPVARDLHAADITLGNLEGTLSTGGVSKCASLPQRGLFRLPGAAELRVGAAPPWLRPRQPGQQPLDGLRRLRPRADGRRARSCRDRAHRLPRGDHLPARERDPGRRSSASPPTPLTRTCSTLPARERSCAARGGMRRSSL